MSYINKYYNLNRLDDEQKDAYLENVSDHIIDDINNLMNEHRINLMDIEASYIIESYSMVEMSRMCENEVEVYTESFSDIWNKFVNWIKNIVNAILGKVKDTKENTDAAKNNEPVVIDTNPAVIDDAVVKTTNIFKNIFNYKKEDGSLNLKKILTEIGVTTGAGIGSIFAFSKNEKIKTTRGKLIDWLTRIGNHLNDLAKQLFKKKPKALPEGKPEDAIILGDGKSGNNQAEGNKNNENNNQAEGNQAEGNKNTEGNNQAEGNKNTEGNNQAEGNKNKKKNKKKKNKKGAVTEASNDVVDAADGEKTGFWGAIVSFCKSVFNRASEWVTKVKNFLMGKKDSDNEENSSDENNYEESVNDLYNSLMESCCFDDDDITESYFDEDFADIGDTLNILCDM